MILNYMTVEGEGTPSWNVGESSGLSSPMPNKTGGGARATEDDLSKSRITVWSQARQRTFLLLQYLLTASKGPHNSCLVLAARCSFQSMPSDPSMPASASTKPSVNFKTVLVLSIGSGSGSGSGSSAYSRTFCFRISTNWCSVRSWSWECSNQKTSSTFYLWICGLGFTCCVWGQMK